MFSVNLELITFMKVKIIVYQGKSCIIAKRNVYALFRNKQKYNYSHYMQVMLMRLMSKIEYLIMPKGMKFTGSGTLWWNTPLEQKLSIFATLPHHMFGVQILQKCMPSTFFSLTITWGVVNCDSNIYRCMFKDALAYQSEFVFPWGEFIETIL